MALDINAFKVGIYNKLNVSNITNLVTGVYNYKAPQGTAYPYICYWIVTDMRADTFRNWQDELLLQVDIFSDSNSASEVGTIAKAVAGELDEATITVVGYTNVFCQRGMTRLLYEDETAIWHEILEYRLIMSKSK